MEILLVLIFGLASVFVITITATIAFGWMAHKIFGADASWLDYGVSEDDF